MKYIFHAAVNIFQYSGKIFEYVKIILCTHKGSAVLEIATL
jgi:hypothetical protein